MSAENNMWMPVKLNESAVDYVVSTVRNALRDGKLKPGDRLPSEDELASGLSVSRGTIREAMKVLRAYGVVEIHQGRGTYIVNSKDKISTDAIMFSFIMLQPSESECWEYRALLERVVLENAVRYASNDDILKLRNNLDATKRAVSSSETSAKLDIEFHYILGSIVPNRLISSSYTVAIGFLEPTFIRNHNIKNHVNHTIKVHTETVRVIEQKDYASIPDLIEMNRQVWNTLI